MNRREGDELALRKEVLLARSKLCRLKVRFRADALRESLTWRGAGAELAGSPAARDALFLVAAEGVGRNRVARWLAWAGRALAVARMTNLALALLRARRDGPPD